MITAEGTAGMNKRLDTRKYLICHDEDG